MPHAQAVFPKQSIPARMASFFDSLFRFPQPAANRATAATDAANINTARELLHLTTPKPHSHPLLPQR